MKIIPPKVKIKQKVMKVVCMFQLLLVPFNTFPKTDCGLLARRGWKGWAWSRSSPLPEDRALLVMRQDRRKKALCSTLSFLINAVGIQ